MMMGRFGLFTFLLMLITPYSQAATLTHIKTQSGFYHSKIEMTLSQPTTGKMKYDPDHSLVSIKLNNTYSRLSRAKKLFFGSNIVSMQMGNVNKNDWLIHIKIKNPVKPQVKFIKDNISGKVKVHIEIQSILAFPKENIISEKKQTKKIKEQHLDDLLSLLSSLKVNARTHSTMPTGFKPSPIIQKPKTLIIVIDAGHGGKDPGAIGKKGSREKDIVLSIAKKLAAKINHTPHMKAVMTRNKDEYVSLRKRLTLARQSDAEIFIAIHADAFFYRRSKGASVFALSRRGATSEAARWLAKKDNYSELGGIELDALQDRSALLRSVLIDLAQTATIAESLKLGNKVLDNLDIVTTLHHSQVEQAPFVVLKSPDIPSILVESGFITNPSEERRLISSQYQEKLAAAILAGIKQYQLIMNR